MQDFRNLKVWQKAHALTLAVYRGTASFPQHEAFGMRSQMRRAAFWVPCKIAESCGRIGDAEVYRLLQVALGSSSELEYLLLLARDLNYLTEEVHKVLEQDVIEVRKMLTGLVHRVDSGG